MRAPTIAYVLRGSASKALKRGNAMKTTVLLIVAVMAADVGLTSRDLHTKYGPSDVERFRVRPDLDATVQYGSDGGVCQVLLAEPVSVTEVPTKATGVSGDGMQAVTNEFAPPDVRGARISEGSFQASCAMAAMSDYEHVLIERGATACPTSPGKTDTQTRILFKRDACPHVNSPTRATSP